MKRRRNDHLRRRVSLKSLVEIPVQNWAPPEAWPISLYSIYIYIYTYASWNVERRTQTYSSRRCLYLELGGCRPSKRWTEKALHPFFNRQGLRLLPVVRKLRIPRISGPCYLSIGLQDANVPRTYNSHAVASVSAEYRSCYLFLGQVRFPSSTISSESTYKQSTGHDLSNCFALCCLANI